jgi:hypothetical protein
MTRLIRTLMGPIDALRECLSLFKAGFCYEDGCWKRHGRIFYSRSRAVDHLRALMLGRAIERSVQR